MASAAAPMAMSDSATHCEEPSASLVSVTRAGILTESLGMRLKGWCRGVFSLQLEPLAIRSRR